MGSDLYAYAEVPEGKGGWRLAPGQVLQYDPDDLDASGKPRPGAFKDVPQEQRMYQNRSSTTFSILTGVERFRGCTVEYPWEPICEPRGLPPDLSPEVRSVVEAWEAQDSWLVSPSYLTVAEFADLPWEQKTLTLHYPPTVWIEGNTRTPRPGQSQTATYADLAADFLGLLPRLRKLARQHGDARVVWWLDQ